MQSSVFQKYLQSTDPEVRRRANAWLTAVNNRIFSGEMVSPWLINLAEKHILGEISLEEVTDQLTTYWSEIDYIMEHGFTDPS